jgi:hypothetical protein
MHAYTYPFRLEERSGEVFFTFPHFPEIISSLPRERVAEMTPADSQGHANDAVLVALQARIAAREDTPSAHNAMHVRADGFVALSVPQAMKLELYSLSREYSRTLSEFARHINKDETVARRLLDLRHNSLPSHIESAIAAFGGILVHNWDIDTQPAFRSSIVKARTSQPS